MLDCFTPRIMARFWRKVARLGSDECWPWLGGVTSDGYGLFHCNADYTCTAHRYAAEAVRGEKMPRHLDASHICPYPHPDPLVARGCCNPKHITFESRSANVRRSKARRRNARRSLSDDQVREVLRLWQQQGHRRGLGPKFGVDRQTIYKVTAGYYYRDVTGLVRPG